jgi:hypothetical protein
MPREGRGGAYRTSIDSVRSCRGQDRVRGSQVDRHDGAGPRLLEDEMATEAELMVQKPRQARRRVKDEAPPDPPADFTPGGPHSEEEEP